jgi:hypothetical protein
MIPQRLIKGRNNRMDLHLRQSLRLPLGSPVCASNFTERQADEFGARSTLR